MAKFTEEDDALLEELGVEIEAKKEASRTPREERMIAGFEEIQRFVEQHGRTPQHGEDRDIFERLYAVRLDRLRELDDCRAVLEPLDHQGLLAGAKPVTVSVAEEIDDDELLAQLGVEDAAPANITELRHVRSAADKRAAEEIANRQKCEDFEQFKPLFEQVQKELERGPAADEGVRTKVRDCARPVLHPGRPESLCRGNGGALYQRTRVHRRPASCDLRQRDREQLAHAVSSTGAAKRPCRPTNHRTFGRPVVCRSE